MSFFKKFKNKKILVATSVILLASLSVGIIYVSKNSNNSLPEENYVETYTIADNEKIFINGVILPTKSKEFTLPSESEISKLNVKNGKIVKEGELLFTVKNEDVLNEIDMLKAQISELENTSITTELDPLINSEINKLKAQVSALDKKAYTNITAPFAGKVYFNDNNMDSEYSSTITLQSTTFYMKGQASEEDLSKLQIDDPVSVTVLSTNKNVSGRISLISDRPSTNQGDNTQNTSLSYYDINVSFENQEDLVNGFHVQACIEVTDNLCKIPTTSILKDENDKPFVFESFDGILKKQIVEIQSQNDEFTVIKGGLDKKDIIVRYPSQEMSEGDVISVDNLEVNTKANEGAQSE